MSVDGLRQMFGEIRDLAATFGQKIKDHLRDLAITYLAGDGYGRIPAIRTEASRLRADARSIDKQTGALQAKLVELTSDQPTQQPTQPQRPSGPSLGM